MRDVRAERDVLPVRCQARRRECSSRRLARAAHHGVSHVGLRLICYLHLRNVKRFDWNHKRVSRIYRVLERNLRIKPKQRLVRATTEPLAVPGAIKSGTGRARAQSTHHVAWTAKTHSL